MLIEMFVRVRSREQVGGREDEAKEGADVQIVLDRRKNIANDR